MKLMTFIGATMLTLAACDPAVPIPDTHASTLSGRNTSNFAFDNVSVSLSPAADIDPNGDCTFAEGTVDGQSTRFLVEDPVRMCPKGSSYRTCSLTSIASFAGIDGNHDARLEATVTWVATTQRAEHLEISALALVNGRLQIAMQPWMVDSGTSGTLKRNLVSYGHVDALALTFRIMTPCDGTGTNQTGTSTFSVTSARIVQDLQ